MEQLMRERAQPISLRRTLGTKNTLFDLEKRSKKLLTKGLSRDLRLKKAVLDLKKIEKLKNIKELKNDIIQGIRNLLYLGIENKQKRSKG